MTDQSQSWKPDPQIRPAPQIQPTHVQFDLRIEVTRDRSDQGPKWTHTLRKTAISRNSPRWLFYTLY